jgi:hypothetical protein
MHASLSHWIALARQKFDDKIIDNFTAAIAKH